MRKSLLSIIAFLVANASFAQWTTSGSDIYNSNAGNVGIGTASPSGNLHVKAASGFSELYVQGASSTTGMYLFDTSTESGLWKVDNGYMAFGTTNAERIRIGASGNVGIGTTSPAALLTVGSSNPFQVSSTGIVNISSTGAFLNAVNGGTGANYMNLQNDIGNLFMGVENNTGNGLITGNIANSFAIRSNTGVSISGNNGASVGLHLNSSNNVGIGTTTPDSKLTVAGKIHSQEVKVTVDAGADFVFQQDYTLPDLGSVEEHIRTKKHLPGIAPAKEMETKGIELGEMNIKLLQKIEELTLYLIEQKKEIRQLKDRMARLEK